jgi:hypothetical protein
MTDKDEDNPCVPKLTIAGGKHFRWADQILYGQKRRKRKGSGR